MIYNELDMYDTEIRTYGKKYGTHNWGLLSNSKGMWLSSVSNAVLQDYILWGLIRRCVLNND